MRLGQLARKLDRKPQELVDFLAKEHQITIETDFNTKVDGEALVLLQENFKKVEVVEAITLEIQNEETKPQLSSLEETVVEQAEETVEPEVVLEFNQEEADLEISEAEVEDLAAEAVVAEIEEEEIEDIAATAVVAEIDAEEKSETIVEKIARVGEDGEELPELIIEDGVIKAPKQELDGFKVVGKIDLPTTKRSIQFLVTNGDETKDVTEEIIETRKREKEAAKREAFEARKARATKKVTKRPRKTLTDADRKAFEVKRAERKRNEAEKLQAIKRKKHYEENVQKKAAASSKKKKEKEIEKAVKKQKAPKIPEPTTRWGKFKKWLNT